MNDWSIRVAGPDDIPRIVELRLEFLEAVGRPVDARPIYEWAGFSSDPRNLRWR